MSELPSPPKARLPRGFVDRTQGELTASAKMLDVIGKVYQLYGFAALETPAIEFTDALGKFLPDLDRPNEGVFSFKDDDESWLSLRYDLTAPLARFVAEHYDSLPKPYRSYRCGYVFRNEKPGPGRFRQFMQFDADTVGAASPAADAEICMMAADTLEALGISRNDYVVKVNNRKILDGAMEAIGLGGPQEAARRLTVLRAIDKLDRLGVSGVTLLLGMGRKDESGDFTKGAALEPQQAEALLHLFGGGVTDMIGYDGPLRQNAIFAEGVAELKQIETMVRAAGYGPERVRIDPTVVRGLEYYTGPVFEAELTFEIKDSDGRLIRFGSVGGGGRYDGLVGRFRGEKVPATGFSIGVSRLFAALQAVGSPLIDASSAFGPVVVLVMDREEIVHYQKLVGRLRQAGIAAELYLGAAGMNAQLKYADKRHACCAVIQGSNERAASKVSIKDLILGANLGAKAKERADYLELKQKAQMEVPEDQLVETVQQVLARYR